MRKHRTPMRNCALWNLEIPGSLALLAPPNAAFYCSAFALRASAAQQQASIQIGIELVTPVAADQGQFQRGAIGIDPRRHAVELERETFHAGWRVLDRLRHRQAPVRRRALDEKINGPVVR